MWNWEIRGEEWGGGNDLKNVKIRIFLKVWCGTFSGQAQGAPLGPDQIPPQGTGHEPPQGPGQGPGQRPPPGPCQEPPLGPGRIPIGTI